MAGSTPSNDRAVGSRPGEPATASAGAAGPTAASGRWRALVDQAGATTLEWTLLLAFIAIPSYYILRITMNLLVDHYRLMSTVNSLPFP